MKSSYRICTLLLMMLLLSSTQVLSQNLEEEDPPPFDPTNLKLLTGDGTGRFPDEFCPSRFGPGDDLILELAMVNPYYFPGQESFTLPDVNNCSPFRVAIAEENTNTILWVSDILDKFTFWADGDDTDCIGEFSAFFYKKIRIDLALHDYCRFLENGLYPLDVNFLIVGEDPVNGEYIPYKQLYPDCFDSFWPEDCFTSEHHGENGEVEGHICIACESERPPESNYLSGMPNNQSPVQQIQHSYDRSGAENNISLYPNPFTNELSLNYQLSQDAELQVILFNAKGQQVMQRTFSRDAGAGTLTLFTQDLTAGIYFCKFWDGIEFQNFKVLKADH